MPRRIEGEPDASAARSITTRSAEPSRGVEEDGAQPAALLRLGLFSLGAVLLLSACGGASESDGDTVDTTTATAAEAPAGSRDDGDVDDDGDSDSGDIIEQGGGLLDEMTDGDGGMATITIGDQTREFTFYESVPIATCDSDFFGGFLAVLTSGDDIMAPFDQIMVTLPGGDFEDPPEVTLNLKVDEEAEWIADETIYERYPDFPPGIGVTSFTIDDQTASGTATFYQEESLFQVNAGKGELLVMDGTFSVTCSGS